MSPGASRRVAAIDCGTNSVRLLIADVVDGRLHDLHREMRIVRLGQDVDRTGRLAAEALDRTRLALQDYADTIDRSGVDAVRMVATSATRDARNRADFVAMVHSVLGVEPEVVTGVEEARLSFVGASGVVGTDDAVLVADIGGGSTELVHGRPGYATRIAAHSMDVGSVRLTERHFRDDPPTPDQIAAAEADVRSALSRAAADVPDHSGPQLVGVAGTVTTVAAIALGLTRYDPGVIHGARISAAEIDRVTAMLLAMPRDERAAIPALHPGRVDVIAAGGVILRTLVAWAGASEVVASEHDILDGIALTLGGAGDQAG